MAQYRENIFWVTAITMPGKLSRCSSLVIGEFLKTTLDLNGISTQNLARTDRVHTTLVFVLLDEKGDRSFIYCRNPGADILLTPENVHSDLLCNTQVKSEHGGGCPLFGFFCHAKRR